MFQSGADFFLAHQDGFGDFIFVVAQDAAEAHAFCLVKVHFFVAEADGGVEAADEFDAVGGVRGFFRQLAQGTL